MRRKIWPLAATTIALVLGMGLGSAGAYFTDNTYATGGLEITPDTTGITEENGGGKKVVCIQNKSTDASMWVRVKVFAAAKLAATAAGQGWVGPDNEGWYTYTEPLPPHEKGEQPNQTLPLTVNFELGNLTGAVTGDETNVVVVYECTPVTYDAGGKLITDPWKTKDGGKL